MRLLCLSFLLGILAASSADAAARAEVSTTGLAFGNVAIASIRDARFSVFNTGDAPMTVSAIGASGGVFTVVSPAGLPQTVAPGGFLPVTIRFSPTAEGPATGSVTVVTSAASQPAPVQLSGVGVPNSSSTPRLTINDVQVAPGGQGSLHVSLANVSGTGVTAVRFDLLVDPTALTITSVTTGGAAVAAERSLTVTAIPGGFNVRLVGATPAAIADGVIAVARFVAGPATATATARLASVEFGTTVNTRIPAAFETTALVAIAAGNTPMISLSPPVADFGIVRTGSSTTRTITLQNSGTATLEISQLSITSGGNVFALVNPPLTITLSPGGTTNVQVRLTPVANGALTGALSIVSNSQNTTSTSRVQLVGVGLGSGSISLDVDPNTTVRVTAANDTSSAEPGLQVSLIYSNLAEFEGQSLTLEYTTVLDPATIARTATVQNGRVEFQVPLPSSDPNGQLILRTSGGTILQTNTLVAGSTATGTVSTPSVGGAGGCSLGAPASACDLLAWLLLAPMALLRKLRKLRDTRLVSLPVKPGDTRLLSEPK